jgi:hypothetical protein
MRAVSDIGWFHHPISAAIPTRPTAPTTIHSLLFMTGLLMFKKSQGTSLSNTAAKVKDEEDPDEESRAGAQSRGQTKW